MAYFNIADPAETSNPGTPAPTREVPVNWEALEGAFENNSPEVHSYLHVITGDVLRVVDGVADPATHLRISASRAYVRIEPVNSREQYQWLERFIATVEDDALCEKLLDAIDGKGAFRRFKDELMAWPAERDQWIAFRRDRLRVHMEAWLTDRQLVPVERAEPLVSESSIELKPVTQAELNGPPRPPKVDVRAQLESVMSTLGARDAEKVLLFAEFVSSRAGR